ncbi:MAG TPA: hypothetical protein VF994_17405 [Myxococcales bacterium]
MDRLRLAVALRSLALAVWFGGGIATVLATSAVFAKAETRKVAGDFAGAILRRANLLRGVAALTFGLAVLLGAAGIATWLGAGCLLLQVAAIPVDAATRRFRRALGGNVDALAPEDPRRRRFGALHGLAMLLLLLQVLLSAAALSLQ